MRIILSIIAGCAALILSACGGPSQNPRPFLPGSTGHFDRQGVDYTSGGDPRVDEALRQSPDRPSTPNSGSSLPPAELSKRLKEFEISRFAVGEKSPSRFGSERVLIKLFFVDRNAIEFRSPLRPMGENKYSFETKIDGYALSGELEDGKEKTQGKFVLSDSAASQTATIFYRAYRGKLTVRQDVSRPIAEGSKAQQQIKTLTDNTFAWVNNWAVLNGPSFYLVDVVKVVSPGVAYLAPPPVLSFKGESKRTGEFDHPAKNLTNESDADISLIGNAERESRRLFQVEVEEKKGEPKSEFLLDVEMEDPESAPLPITEDEKPQEFKSDGKAYLALHSNSPRSLQMARDFERNRELVGVRQWIKTYQNRLRPDLQNFYDNANPFRRAIEGIGAAYDVSPAFAYLSAVESNYFTGFTNQRYTIEKAKTSTALGPFQLLDGTARALHVKVTNDASDERRYFAPSACGAARYVSKLTDMFRGNDATVAILAYYQGEGGAAAAIYCSFDQSVEDAQACVKKINSKDGFRGKDYARFLKLAKSYNFSYAEMERTAAISRPMRDYVNKKLAVYFISSDMTRYGFAVSPSAPTELPNNGTVTPTLPIQDQKCREAVLPLLAPLS